MEQGSAIQSLGAESFTKGPGVSYSVPESPLGGAGSPNLGLLDGSRKAVGWMEQSPHRLESRKGSRG